VQEELTCLSINNNEFLVKSDISIIEATKYIGIQIPRFCYHESLSIAGNCRMCLVELENSEKLVIACLTIIQEEDEILTNTLAVKKARENILETLLLNHPLDCPICDQAGECDLQEQTKIYGSNTNKLHSKKRTVEDKNCGVFIKTVMTRCIHCTRCVRFSKEISNKEFFGLLQRGEKTEIGQYVDTFFNSNISGNVIDLCPVGALTSSPYAFKARP
jgi:NADH dehydrogenase/NADH:ubiquinone oxidoreductase subunit G